VLVFFVVVEDSKGMILACAWLGNGSSAEKRTGIFQDHVRFVKYPDLVMKIGYEK
jgi:hypothetical protein